MERFWARLERPEACLGRPGSPFWLPWAAFGLHFGARSPLRRTPRGPGQALCFLECLSGAIRAVLGSQEEAIWVPAWTPNW